MNNALTITTSRRKAASSFKEPVTATVCPAPGCTRITNGGRCHAHPMTTSPHDEQRRRDRRRSSGRNTKAWARMRAATIARDEACTRCGSTTDLTAHHLTYPAGSIDDLTTLCRRCHGHVDGGRVGSVPQGDPRVLPDFGRKLGLDVRAFA
ncbi:MAG: HNH endonuclease [Acidimicrobiales bacterium]